MSLLLASLGRWSFRHPWRVLAAWMLILLIAAGGAIGLGKGFDNAFDIPGTESQEGLSQLERTFPQVAGTAAQAIIIAAPGEAVTDPEYRTAITDTVTAITDLPGVAAATSPYDELVSGALSDDNRAAIVRVQFTGQSQSIPDDVVTRFSDTVHSLRDALPEGATVSLGGDLFATEVPTITLTEGVGVVIALIVLLVTFRSFVLAGMPLGIALLGVGVSMLGIVAATRFAPVSATTPMLALMLGLAVGIDYALFIAARHQDQVRAGVEPEESASRATGTAGSAVVFAGVTVLIALIGLGFAGIPFLTTMGVAAACAVFVAVLIAVTLTPALLGFARRRIRTTSPRRRSHAAAPPAGFATRWVNAVTRHPILITVAVVVGLGVVAIPSSSLALALPNAGMLPTSSEARQTYDLTAEHFGEGVNGPLILTGTIITSTDPLGLMDDLRRAVEEVPGVASVALSTPNATADTGIVQVIPETAPADPATADLVRELRAHHDEWLDTYGIDLKVTGFTAVSIDISDRLASALLPFGIFVVGLSVVLLMIVFRSIWVPVTAAVGYLLSVLAAFGVVAAVFEWGWGAELLHVSRTGPVIAFMPIVVMGVLFGLAMDYQVFLVSRMREDYVHAARVSRATRGLAVDAVRSGFTASARVVTAAAVIMFAVFAAFVPEGDSNIKPIALALAVGIAVDAFLVRMTLIPAVMALLGRSAWWMPRWLDRLLPVLDIEGEAVERERELSSWPGDGSAVAVDDLSLVSEGRTLASGVRLRIPPGGHLMVLAEERTARALLFAITGRLAPTSGRLRVDGLLLPGRPARHRTVLISPDDPDAVDIVRRAAGRRPALVAIEGLDRMPLARVGELRRALANLPDSSVVIATAREATVTLSPDADLLDLTETLEVTR